MRSSIRGGRYRYAEEDVFGGADRSSVVVGRVWPSGDRDVPEDGGIRAILLPVEAEVHGHGRGGTR
jgi:hypothetical protein